MDYSPSKVQMCSQLYNRTSMALRTCSRSLHSYMITLHLQPQTRLKPLLSMLSIERSIELATMPHNVRAWHDTLILSFLMESRFADSNVTLHVKCLQYYIYAVVIMVCFQRLLFFIKVLVIMLLYMLRNVLTVLRMTQRSDWMLVKVIISESVLILIVQ